MPYSGIGRYLYRSPSQFRFDYLLDRPGADSSWRTATSGDTFPFPGTPPFPTLAWIESIASKSPAVVESSGVITLLYKDSLSLVKCKVDTSRWVIVRRMTCSSADSCAQLMPRLYYRYAPIGGVYAVESITSTDPDSLDPAQPFPFQGGYYFTGITINEPIPESLFVPVSARSCRQLLPWPRRERSRVTVTVRGGNPGMVFDPMGRRILAGPTYGGGVRARLLVERYSL